MKPRYIHYRYYDDDDNLFGRGGVTACVILDEEAQMVKVGIAKCSVNDMYNKQVGRDISFGRADRMKHGAVIEHWPGFVFDEDSTSDMSSVWDWAKEFVFKVVEDQCGGKWATKQCNHLGIQEIPLLSLRHSCGANYDGKFNENTVISI